MDTVDALFDALGHVGDADVVTALSGLVRAGADADLVAVNPLALAGVFSLDEERTIATLLHASRLGLFELSWNILCPSCLGILDANTTLQSVRQESYHCAFCAADTEPLLDDTVEVSFTVSPRVRRIAAHDPAGLSFWDYHRHVFFSSGVAFPGPDEMAALADRSVLETIDLAAGERLILALDLPPEPVIVFDPVTHRAQMIAVDGEPSRDRQEITVVYDGVRPTVGHSQLRPGPLRLTLDNRTGGRVLPGVFVVVHELERLLGVRRPYLTAKRLLSNQTFRDIYRTDTLAVDQRLKIMSLSFLFTDLKGSTALYERVGDLVAYDLVRAHFRVLHEIVGRQGGAVVKTIGDAVMATFPLPRQAVAAALAMREAMRAMDRERGSSDLVLKIGLHAGPCLAVNLNDRQDYFGQTVNIASRVQDTAEADSIVATEAVVGDAAATTLLDERGIGAVAHRRALRGIDQSVSVFELS